MGGAGEGEGERERRSRSAPRPIGTRSQGERVAWRCSQRASLRSPPLLRRFDDAEPAAIATATTAICDLGCGTGGKKTP